MPSDDTFLVHLNTLAQRSSWRVCELPAEITGKVLRVLDHRGWVEFRLWELDDRKTPPLQDSRPEDFKPHPMYFGWFSPERDPSAAGDLSQVLARHRDDPRLSAEVRATCVGKAALDEQGVPRESRKEGGTAAPSKRKRNSSARSGNQLRMNALFDTVVAAIEQHFGGRWAGSQRALVAALRKKAGIHVSQSWISRHLTGTRYLLGGNPVRAAKGRGEREAVSRDAEPHHPSHLEAFTMPDDA